MILNKEKVGTITPSQFNDSCIKNQNLIFSGYFDTKVIREKNRSARGMANNNVKLYEQRLANFYTTGDVNSTTGIFEMPSDCYFIDDRGVNFVNSNSENIDIDIILSPEFKKTMASETFPVGVILSKNISVKPTTITDIEVDYYKTPSNPKWTYNTVNGVPYFNIDDDLYNDFDIHESEESNVIIGILSDFGVVKRELEVSNFINNVKQQKENGESRIL